MLALRPVLVRRTFAVCLYNVCSTVVNALHTSQAYSPFIIPHLLPFAELSLIMQLDCTAMFLRSLYSDTSANEDNSFRNHIR